MPTPAVYALSAVLAGLALLAPGVPMLPAHLFIIYFASRYDRAAGGGRGLRGGLDRVRQSDADRLLCYRLAAIAFTILFVFIYHQGPIADRGGWRPSLFRW